MATDEIHEGIGPSLLVEDTGRTAEQHRLAAAKRMASLAAAANHAAADLDGEFPRAARCIQDTAAGFEHLSDLLRDPHLDDVAALIGDLRRYPAVVVVAGVALLSAGLSWLLMRSAGTAGRQPMPTGNGAAGSDALH
jgi:hypothetical protein